MIETKILDDLARRLAASNPTHNGGCRMQRQKTRSAASRRAPITRAPDRAISPMGGGAVSNNGSRNGHDDLRIVDDVFRGAAHEVDGAFEERGGPTKSDSGISGALQQWARDCPRSKEHETTPP